MIDIPCDCGNPIANWYGAKHGRRTWCCEDCYKSSLTNAQLKNEYLEGIMKKLDDKNNLSQRIK